jgi:hypothetical protein
MDIFELYSTSDTDDSFYEDGELHQHFINSFSIQLFHRFNIKTDFFKWRSYIME